MNTTSKNKNIAVYDRWFFRLGGGERMVCQLLASLRNLGHTVTLVTQVVGDLQKAEAEFGIDLSQINVQLVPDVEEEKLGAVTKDYDVFINASHFDTIPNLAKLGILLVFFPAAPAGTFKEKIKRQFIIPFLRFLFLYPKRLIGFGSDQRIQEKATITFSRQEISLVTLTLHFPQFAASLIERLRFFCGAEELHPTTFAHVRQNCIDYTFKDLFQLRDRGITIKVPPSEYATDIFLQAITIPSFSFKLWKRFAQRFPTASVRLTGGASDKVLEHVKTYQHIIGISTYTQDWISRYWNLSSDRLYPPVHTEGNAKSKKKNQIIHVGRFFAGGHSKKQLELVHAFKTLVDGGLNDWELHFVGRPASEPIHHTYFQAVQEQAKGYPIQFHTQASNAELQSLFASSKIYWHATGLGEDLEHQPDAAEHFGITTVEAMAAGCVPIVYRSGGQPEIVTPEVGYTYKTIDELIDQTRTLIADPSQFDTLASMAKTRAQTFSTDAFKSQLKKLLSQYEI